MWHECVVTCSRQYLVAVACFLLYLFVQAGVSWVYFWRLLSKSCLFAYSFELMKKYIRYTVTPCDNEIILKTDLNVLCSGHIQDLYTFTNLKLVDFIAQVNVNNECCYCYSFKKFLFFIRQRNIFVSYNSVANEKVLFRIIS